MITEEAWLSIQPDLMRQMYTFCHHYNVESSFAEDTAQTLWIVAQTTYKPSKGRLLRFLTDAGRYLIIDHARKLATEHRHKKRQPMRYGEVIDSIAIEQLIRDHEKEIAQARWRLVSELMKGREHSMEAQVLDVMYQYVITHDKLPSRRHVARVLGVHHNTVKLAIDKIVRALGEAE